MFRRKRSASQHHHPLSTASTQSAHSAATRAFLKSQPSSNSLSSAAAAAALRSLTPTPTSVENVQTKRMLQRQSSVSSQPSRSPSLRPSSRNGLRRVNSSASMSARTFRDQSPRRLTSSYGSPGVAPPLPSIPSEYSARKNQNRRSVSLGPKVWSSNSQIQSTEGAMGTNPPVDEPGVGTASLEHRRSESRNSINFSYPMISRTNSPTLPSGFPDRRDLAINTVQSDHATPANASLDKRHVAQTNRSGRQQVQGPGSRSPGKSPRAGGTALLAAQAAVVTRNDEPNTPPASSRTAHYRNRTAYDRSPSRSPASVDMRPRPQVKKPPTIVEDRQDKERLAPEPSTERKDHQVVNTTPSKQLNRAESPRAHTPPISERLQESLRTPPVSPPESNFTTESDGEFQPSQLRQLRSPGRTTRFPTQLAVMNFAGEQLHQPPPRSVSPAKSALKFTRNSSLSPDGRIHGILRPGPPLSELSDATSVASDDGARPNIRRKSVKVSFDDEAEVVGVAASPPTSPEDIVPESPPGQSKSKTGWFGLPKRRSSPLRSTEVDEFDGVLKPRAALPSFGSIRASKGGAHPDITRQELNDNESTTSSDLNEEISNWSFSNDHAIGNIISRASPEHVQKQGQIDNALPNARMHTAARDAGTESQKENIPTDESYSEPVYFQKTPLSPLPEAASEQNLMLTPNPILAMPDITVQPATPEIEKGRPSVEEYGDPEKFTRLYGDTEAVAPSHMKGKKMSHEGTATETDDESSESIYSDAEEGLDDHGFGSINAVLDDQTAGPSSAAAENGAAVTSTSKDEAQEADQEAAMTDIPETCRTARAVTPMESDPRPAGPVSPAPVKPPLVSTSYSSPPTQPEDKTDSVRGQVARSPTVPVAVYTIAKFRDTDGGSKGETHRYDQPEYNAPQTRDQKTDRVEPWEPTPRKGVHRPNEDEVDVNGAGAHLPRRQLSNGSDSSSSFKRSRRASRAGMRRTLRGSHPSSSVPSSPTIVTVSPPESRSLRSGLGTGTMRSTLRSAPRKEKPSFFSAGKSQIGKPVRSSGTSFASRFPDSDSDSDGGFQNRRLQRRLRSLSEDHMRPVRGIPRRQGTHDGDSTELEDSSDNESPPSSGPKPSARQLHQLTPVRDPALAAVAKSRGMTEAELEELLRRGSPRKPNLLNRLSIKKSKPLGRRRKFHPDEPSPDGTIPEHALQSGNDSHKATIAASSPRLVKKSLQKSSGSTAWPLSSENADTADAGIRSSALTSTSQPLPRPQTSDGAAVNGNNVVTSQHTPEDSNAPYPSLDQEQLVAGSRASDVVIESSGRKKRFQRLRMAFGIRG